MDSIFPNYVATMKSGQPMQRVTEQVIKWVSQKKYNVETLYSMEKVVLCLSSCSGEILHYNSFLPLVKIIINQERNKTSIDVTFGLRKDVEILMLVIFGAAIFTGFFLFGLLLNQIIDIIVLLIPMFILLMLIFFYFVCFKGLSQKFLKELSSALIDVEKDFLELKIRW